MKLFLLILRSKYKICYFKFFGNFENTFLRLQIQNVEIHVFEDNGFVNRVGLVSMNDGKVWSLGIIEQFHVLSIGIVDIEDDLALDIGFVCVNIRGKKLRFEHIIFMSQLMPA